MKSFLSVVLLCSYLAFGCASSQQSLSADTAQSVRDNNSRLLVADSGQQATDAQAQPKTQNFNDDQYNDYGYDTLNEERIEIADPIEPVNRVMYQFNDKLYFWALKPVAQGYKVVVPEPARISVKNFFFNLGFPVRFLSCLLQADFSGAAGEFGRFGINTIWGIGGLLDPSSGNELDLQKQDTDLGQTLGVYGVGHGFYIVWPLLGPSSPRDSVDIVGDHFLYPVSYINPWYAGLGVRSFEIVNSTSLRIGDYEALQEAAIDPYVALRDAYIQYRQKKVKARQARSLFFRNEEATAPVVDKEITQVNILHGEGENVTNNFKVLTLVMLIIITFSRMALASGPFGPPQTVSKEAGGLNTAIGYFYSEDTFKNDNDHLLRQNSIYSQVAYSGNNIWEIYGRIGMADLKISDAFSSTNSSTITSKLDFSDNWKFFGTLGAKAFYPLSGIFGIGAFIQGSYHFSNYNDSVSGSTGGSHFIADLKIKDLWDVNSGVGFQITAPWNIKLYTGPYVYYAEAKANLGKNIPGIEYAAGNVSMRNKSIIGGFGGVDIPFFKGFHLNIDGRYAERFSAGAAIIYRY